MVMHTDIVKTNKTAVLVSSSNIYYIQDYGYVFRQLLVIFKSIPFR